MFLILLTTEKGKQMLKWVFLASVAVFVTWHFYPKQTENTGRMLGDKASRAGKELIK